MGHVRVRELSDSFGGVSWYWPVISASTFQEKGYGALYTEMDREQLLDDLRALAEGMARVQGMVLVGSGAYGYRDRYSDLDVVVVVEQSSSVSAVHDALISALELERPVLKHKVYRHEPDIFVSCLLFPGYLELDLGVWSLTKLRATKGHWTVVFDRRAPAIDERLHHTEPSSLPNLQETARESMTYMWQFIRGALAASARGNQIKAFKEMEYLRDKVAELAALREGIQHDVAKELGRIQSSVIERLQATYEGSMDQAGSMARLRTLVELYCDVISEILGPEVAQPERDLALDMMDNFSPQ